MTILLQLAILGYFIWSGWDLAHRPFTPWALASWPLLAWFSGVTAYLMFEDLTSPPAPNKRR
jgi:uncharacterized membrane protein YozB (DUF420 family)